MKRRDLFTGRSAASFLLPRPVVIAEQPFGVGEVEAIAGILRLLLDRYAKACRGPDRTAIEEQGETEVLQIVGLAADVVGAGEECRCLLRG